MRTRLKIVHILLSKGFAGTERSTVESCNSQCQAHDVTLIIRKNQSKKSGAGIKDKLRSGVQVLEVSPFWNTSRKIENFIQSLNPDVVHAHLRKSTRILSKLRINAAKISTLHIGINGKGFLEMDALIAISPWQMAHIPKSYTGLVRWIRNSLTPHVAIPSEQTQQRRREICPDSQRLIGGVGRLSHSKGWDVLIEAFRRANIPNCALAIIGEGSHAGKLRKLAQGLNVKFLGFKHNIKDYYPCFDIFVCPSREEPMGRVILEALDAGTPVIASNIEGPKDILSEFPGRLFESEDADDLARALTSHFDKQPNRVTVDLSSHFAENVNQSIVDLYHEAIAANQVKKSSPSTKSHD
jgi:glycosyltransferase involved in cell wall biosynthesis